MSQRAPLIVCAIFLLVLFGTIFILEQRRNAPPVDPWQLPNGIKIINRAENRQSLVNTAEGYEFIIPSGWQREAIDKTNYVALYSPETQNQKTDGDLEEGCKLVVGVDPKTQSLEEIEESEKESNQEWHTVKENSYSRIKLQNYEGLKEILNSEEGGYSISLYVPRNEKLYNLVMMSAEKDRTLCTDY